MTSPTTSHHDANVSTPTMPLIVISSPKSPRDKNKQKLSEYAVTKDTSQGSNTEEVLAHRSPDVFDSPGDVFSSPGGADGGVLDCSKGWPGLDRSDSLTYPPNLDAKVLPPPPSWTAAKTQSVERRPGTVRLKCYLNNSDLNDSLHHSGVDDVLCAPTRCAGSLMLNPKPAAAPREGARDAETVKQMAVDFIDQYYTAIKRKGSVQHKTRMTQILNSVEQTNSYDLTSEELLFGAKTAWRNAERCVGRGHWSTLQVIDARNAETTSDMFEALCRHLRYATNDGNIRSVITVFPQRSAGHVDFRVWNPQLIIYAGYQQPDGLVIGDPARIAFTEVCQRLGWKGRGGQFDVLPLVLQANGGDPEVFEIPQDIVLEVQITHPNYPWFAELGLKWFAVPAVANMLFDCGGLQFPACPFNGWYMGSEIGARNFADTWRYNMLQTVAEKLELDTSKNATLWKDRALVELNIAVLHSYAAAQVTMVDHHTVTESFMYHMRTEHRLRGGCPADWVWIVPPISGSVCPVFHQEMLRYHLKPSYDYQIDAWKVYRWGNTGEKALDGGKSRYKLFDIAWAVRFLVRTMKSILSRRPKVTILYATESGKSYVFALKLRDMFMNAFDVRVICMEDYEVAKLKDESLVLMVASTFGNGDPPANGIRFSYGIHNMMKPRALRKSSSVRSRMLEEIPACELSTLLLRSLKKRPLADVRYAVFALGSSAYVDFCEFGRYLDKSMAMLGGRAILDRGEGDEMFEQDTTFQKWAKGAFQAACKSFRLREKIVSEANVFVSNEDRTWRPGKFRLVPCSLPEVDLYAGLSKVHMKEVFPCEFRERIQLQSPDSDRQTILAKFKGSPEHLDYFPGDHLELFPTCPPDVVKKVLGRIDSPIPADKPIRMEYSRKKQTALSSLIANEWVTDERLSYPLTLHTALQQYLDVVSPPPRPVLGYLSSTATDEVEQYRLSELAENQEEYSRWVSDRMPTLADVLDEFGSVVLAPDMVLSQLPLLKSRLYSVSSTPRLASDQVHLTVKVVTFTTPSGSRREGVCSGLLNNIGPGTLLPYSIRRSEGFHLPADDKVPIIMFGAGAGIAPFRGFWQERHVRRRLKADAAGESSFGSMTLYFGCRRHDLDYLHAEEIKQALTEGALDAVHVALSRQPGTPKTYVQNVLCENGAKIADDLMRKQAHVYVCGEIAMAEGVYQGMEKVLVEHMKMTTHAAARYLLNMREMGLYHEDIFGSKLDPTS